jgi:hypothetical protein
MLIWQFVQVCKLTRIAESEKAHSDEDPPPQYPYATDEVALEYNDGLHAVCPPHTTERRLVNKIDWHVVPCLCIMYLLAFLDR